MVVSRPSIALAATAVAAVLLMALPVPSALVDALLSLNLLLAAGLLLLAVATHRVTALGSFPSVLLIAAVLRLAVAVAASRMGLVAGSGSAGLGLIAGVLLSGSVAAAAVVVVGVGVVHHMVVARGAERIAEVAARFALDALPGRQLGIDADVRSGAMDAGTARRMREDLAGEGQMFAAMDGAMKFVRGEAVALALIVGVVLVGALLSGIAGGRPAAQAARQAALLAAAVGVAAQLPALIAALASGILASRAGVAEPHGLGGAMVRQVREALGGGQATPSRIVIETPSGQGHRAEQAERRVAEVLEDLGLPAVPVRIRQRAATRDVSVLLDGVAIASADGEVAAAARKNAHALLGVEETQRLLDDLAATHPALVRETVPKIVSTPLLADVLRRLLREGVPIRPLRDVLEAVAEIAPAEPRAADLCEQIRAARARALTHRFCPTGRAAAIVVDPEVEDTLREALQGETLALDPEIGRDIVEAARRHLDGAAPGRLILCAADVRRHLRSLLENDFFDVPVLSHRELIPELGIDTVGRISVGVSP